MPRAISSVEQLRLLPEMHSYTLLTLAELKLIVGAIYTNYMTKIVDAEGIEQMDAYTSGPKGNKLILEFQRA